MANIEVSKVNGENNWALLLDGDGFVAEGTGDNFFIVKDGELLTPEGRNILRGISRAYIFDIARQIGIACRECNLEPYDVITADEAFMTATPFCILPVTGLNGAKIGSGKRGVITDRLLRTWSENVGLDIEQQIRNYAMEIGQKRLSSPTPYRFN